MERIVEKVRFSGPLQHKLKRVAAYARVSSGKDAMLHSLSAQVSYYNSYIQNRPGWSYSGVYSDEALTGTKGDRPGFQRLMADCRAGNIDIVITKSISRFARNTVTLLETVRELKALGIDVFFEEQRIHTLSTEGELMLTILASYAQEESLSVSENCKWYWKQRMKEGCLVGLRDMFGYDIESGTVTVNEKEAEVVRWLFASYIDGASTTELANALTAAEVPRVGGGKWTATRVRDLLKNEKYTGNALLQKKFVKDHLTKKLVRNKGELPRYYAEETHPAIIDMETYRAAQAIMETHRDHFCGTKPTTQRYPFSGKIICGNCGKNYSHKVTHGIPAWQCTTFLYRGKSACPAKQIPEDTLLSMCCTALGLPQFDENEFKKRINSIMVTGPNAVTFRFVDGHTVDLAWKDRSRAESWTDEMKAAAKNRYRTRSEGLCQEQ
jgi:DNA invertase Pin-like site-specific DNA recombinase